MSDVGVAHVVLDRPPVNALDLATVRMLAANVAQLGRRPAVLTAEGRHFSAGHDRSETHRISENAYLTDFAAALRAILEAPAPLVGVLQGAAVGTGLILAACCEVLIVVDGARISLPEVELGMLGGAGYLARWLPPAWLRRAVLLGEEVPADALVANGAIRAPDLAEGRRTAAAHAELLASRPIATIAEARAVLRTLNIDSASTHDDELKRTLRLHGGPATE
jgi:enoyl-CoA hydratase